MTNKEKREENERLLAEGRKRCNCCREILDEDDFYPSQFKRTSGKCKSCLKGAVARCKARQEYIARDGDPLPEAPGPFDTEEEPVDLDALPFK